MLKNKEKFNDIKNDDLEDAEKISGGILIENRKKLGIKYHTVIDTHGKFHNFFNEKKQENLKKKTE